MSIKTSQVAILAAALAGAMSANAGMTFTYSTDTWSQNYGAISPGDIVTLTSVGGSVNLTPGVPVTANINTLAFFAGPSDYGDADHSVAISQTMYLTSGGIVSGNLLQAGTLHISSADTLSLSDGSTTTFLFPGVGTVAVKPLGLTIGPNAGGTMTADHTAQFTFTAVPEPTTMVAGLGGLGLALLGVFGSRRSGVTKIGQ